MVAPLLEERLVGEGAGRHDAHHLALQRSLGLARLTALFADRDRLALAHQAREIRVQRGGRHAGHRNRCARRCPALRERNVEQLRATTRIVVEHLVEVAHAVEEQHVGMLGLDAQVLLHHGGVIGHGGGGGRFRRKVRNHDFVLSTSQEQTARQAH